MTRRTMIKRVMTMTDMIRMMMICVSVENEDATTICFGRRSPIFAPPNFFDPISSFAARGYWKLVGKCQTRNLSNATFSFFDHVMKIGWFFTEIWLYIDFQNGGRLPSWNCFTTIRDHSRRPCCWPQLPVKFHVNQSINQYLFIKADITQRSR